jgi:predicted DNA-binding transcriptional regulator AlpA
LERVGRAVYINNEKFYGWLSAKSGKEVTPEDNLLKTKDLQQYYSKSNTWLWMQVKAGNIPKPFKINRTNYWLEREIVGEVEAV